MQEPTIPGLESRRVMVGSLAMHARVGGSGPPLVLLHGWPQHSLMWHAIAPALAERFTVIAPDLRGAGASGVAPDGYDKRTMAADVLGLLDGLGVREPACVVGYDLGAGVAVALARDAGDRVRRLAVMEFGLPGFGYEQGMAPAPDWHLGSNWHLSLFSVPDAAEWLVRGRERELLEWFFWHLSFAGNAVAPAHFEAYVRAVSRPGALRAGISYYAAVWRDAADNEPLRARPLAMPVLAVGGEASSGPALDMLWGPVAADLRTHVVPRAGHWLGDENPDDVAAALLAFFGEGAADG